jgi:hypothetical protein
MRARRLAVPLLAAAAIAMFVTAGDAGAGPLPPKRGQALIRWLEARNYQGEGWIAEPTIRPAAGRVPAVGGMSENG